MTALSRVFHRLLSPAGTEDRDRRLREAQVAAASARRTLDNACSRLARKAAEIRALTDGVLERNEEAKDSGE